MSSLIRFISSNSRKTDEYKALLQPVSFIPLQISVREPQGDDAAEVVRAKLIQAFSLKRTPLFVDHTGVYIEALNNLPGALTGILWHKLEAEGFLRVLNCVNNRRALARTLIGYCDGRKVYTFEGEIRGILSDQARGNRDSWTCLFIPEGMDKTLGEMSMEEKNMISMRKIAAQKFKAFLMGR